VKLGSRLRAALANLRKRGCHVTRIELSADDIEDIRDDEDADAIVRRGQASYWNAVLMFDGVPVYRGATPGIPVLAYETS
jgi:hypothetical protein